MKTKSDDSGFWMENFQIEDGVYEGVWGGYEVVMEVNLNRVKFHTKDGIRTMDAPVTVTVTNGKATVETKND